MLVSTGSGLIETQVFHISLHSLFNMTLFQHQGSKCMTHGDLPAPRLNVHEEIIVVEHLLKAVTAKPLTPYPIRKSGNASVHRLGLAIWISAHVTWLISFSFLFVFFFFFFPLG